MPKGSSQSSKALKAGFGITEGTIKVVSACFLLHEFTNKDGDVALTFFGHRWDVVRCDEAGEAESDETTPQYFIVQIAGKDKETGEVDLNKLKFHPGKAKNADDPDPEDLGLEMGTEGNSMYCETATAPFQDADWIEFCKSLETKGWKPEINDQSFAPNYVGTVLKVHTETKPLRLGAKTDAKPQTKWVVDEIYVRPYESKKGGAKGKPATGAASKSTPQSKTSETANSAEPNEAAGEAYRAALDKLLESPAAATKTQSKGLANGGIKLTDFYRAVANEASLAKINGKPIPGVLQHKIIAGMKQYDENEGGFIEQNSEGKVTVDREVEGGLVTAV